jgi:hypothetical protein
MATLEDKISKAFENLPSKYQSVLNEEDITNKVSDICNNFDFTEEQKDVLDKEVTLLLVHISSTPEFTSRVENKLNINEETTAALIKSVTRNVLQPLQKKLDESNVTETEIPVPNPPSKNQGDEPPKPHYGGNSDPYREPSE